MSANGGWLRQVDRNIRGTLATAVRPPRRPMAWPGMVHLVLGLAIATAAVLASMMWFDAWAVSHARQVPYVLVEALNRFTDLGKAGVFLWPTGILLLLLAMIDAPTMPRFARGVLAAWAVRLGFVFCAIAVPSLFTTIVKRLIGRARPFVEGNDVWAFRPFAWKVEYASLPSGHATTAFAALVALGAIFPQARALLWIYAGLIAVSRVVLTSHHPSDVIAGAFVGAFGAMLVRDWFAARGLGFVARPDGSVRAKPGPSLRRIVKAVARRLHSA